MVPRLLLLAVFALSLPEPALAQAPAAQATGGANVVRIEDSNGALTGHHALITTTVRRAVDSVATILDLRDLIVSITANARSAGPRGTASRSLRR